MEKPYNLKLIFNRIIPKRAKDILTDLHFEYRIIPDGLRINCSKEEGEGIIEALNNQGIKADSSLYRLPSFGMQQLSPDQSLIKELEFADLYRKVAICNELIGKWKVSFLAGYIKDGKVLIEKKPRNDLRANRGVEKRLSHDSHKVAIVGSTPTSSINNKEADMKFWKPEEIQQVKDIVAKGINKKVLTIALKELATKLGRDYNSVYSKFTALKYGGYYKHKKVKLTPGPKPKTLASDCKPLLTSMKLELTKTLAYAKKLKQAVKVLEG